MISRQYNIKTIQGQELDQYLSMGWYRMGQTIFTTQFLSFNSQLYTAIWLRLPLQNYVMSKSLRKIYQKVSQQFRVVVQPATFGLDKEILFEQYKKTFKGDFNSSVNAYMLDNLGKNIFNTFECLVYDGEKLIAFSYFDVGEKAIASILGVYDTNYSTYSLGVFTMLEEVKWAMQNKCQYYYPGYFVPGYKRFDYKCRIGNMQYFDYISKTWLPVEQLTTSHLLSEQLKEKLLSIHQNISRFLQVGYLVFYRYFDMWGHANKSNIYDHPLLLLYVIHNKGYVVEYDFKQKIYRLSRIITFNLNFTINHVIIENTKVVELLSPLICEEIIFECDNEKDMSHEILMRSLLEK